MQGELYQLPDVQLQEQANLILQNFKAWLIAHLEFSCRQIYFLEQMDSRMISFLSMQTSFAVGNRLPIKLDKSEAPGLQREKAKKLIKAQSKSNAGSGPDEDFSAEGILTIIIDYED